MLHISNDVSVEKNISHVILVLSLSDPRYSRYRVTLEIIVIEHIQAKNNLFEAGRWKLRSQK